MELTAVLYYFLHNSRWYFTSTPDIVKPFSDNYHLFFVRPKWEFSVCFIKLFISRRPNVLRFSRYIVFYEEYKSEQFS